MDLQNEAPTTAELLQELRLLRREMRALVAHLGLDPILASIEPASDRELNGQYGNPVIDRSPKNWTGEALQGRNFSDLHPATLRALARHYALLAEWHDEQGNRDNRGRPRSTWARLDASRALGWALRLERQGHRGPATPQPQHREERHPPAADECAGEPF